MPDELTNELVRDRLAQADAASGFLLDGLPPQPGARSPTSTAFLAGRGEALDAVIELACRARRASRRLRQRAIEQGRTDDTEEVIANRLAIYERETAPDPRRVPRAGASSCRVDGLGTPRRGHATRIFEALAARGLASARPATAPPSLTGVFRRSIYKSPAELRSMLARRRGDRRGARRGAARCSRPASTPLELDAAAERVIRGLGGVPNFQLVPGYRHTLCVSVNDDVVHGIPSDRAVPCRATSSRSTAVPRSTAGTATPRSPSCFPTRRGPRWSPRASSSRR